MPIRRPPSGSPFLAVIFLMSLAAFSLISTIGSRGASNYDHNSPSLLPKAKGTTPSSFGDSEDAANTWYKVSHRGRPHRVGRRVARSRGRGGYMGRSPDPATGRAEQLPGGPRVRAHRAPAGPESRPP